MTIQRQAATRRWMRASVPGALALWLAAAGCSSPSTAAPPPPSTVATTTTTVPVLSHLSVQGVKPAVLQAPFYPMTTVTAVTCGSGPGGRFVRLDLPAGPAGTPGQSGLSQPSYVIIIPGKAELKDSTGRTVYSSTSKFITTATHGPLVLEMAASNGNVVQVNGDYTCPDTDLPYPGT